MALFDITIKVRLPSGPMFATYAINASDKHRASAIAIDRARFESGDCRCAVYSFKEIATVIATCDCGHQEIRERELRKYCRDCGCALRPLIVGSAEKKSPPNRR